MHLARPALWSSWAPHLRGATGLGGDEVEPGARGTADLFGAVGVPVRIGRVEPGRAWEWTVGPGPLAVDMDHRVEPHPEGCEIAIELRAHRPVELALGATYGPLVALLLRRLARVAERAQPSGADGSRTAV